MKRIKRFTALLIAGNLWAWTALLVFIAIIIVGSIVVYELVQVIHRKLPDGSPGITNDVSEVWLNQQLVYDSQSMPENPSVVAHSFAMSESGFKLQYGINHEPWIALGDSIQEGNISEVQGDQNSYHFAVAMNGTVLEVGFNFEYGYYSQVIDMDNSTYAVVIERSNDLVNWNPVFTNNAYRRWNIENWTDQNPLPDRGFYRVKF